MLHISTALSHQFTRNDAGIGWAMESIFRNAPKNWTVILTADHGLTKYGGHALGTGAIAEEVYLFAHGQGIRTPTMLNEPMEQRHLHAAVHC